jgi:aspartate kinase
MENIIVQKYGGSSLADTEKIISIAKKIKVRVDQNYKLVVVVSAMGKTTDSLLKIARQISASPGPREIDMLITTGEQVSAALLSIALNEIGVKSKSLNAQQAQIKTYGNFNGARIRTINTENILKLFENNSSLIITGFQGINTFGEITTLGRGGSDTSAVALAAALGVDCEIYSDVAGIYTADPRIHPNAKKLKSVCYDEMLEMASLGAKVLHSRSIEIAKKYNTKIYCASTFSNEEGTNVVEKIIEESVVSGISIMENQTLVTISNLPDDRSVVSKVFNAAADEGLNIDMITLINSENFDISFTIIEDETHRINGALSHLQNDLPELNINFNSGYTKISVVGIGMRSSSGVAADFFDSLKEIPIRLVTTSEIKISCLVEKKHQDSAVQALISRYNL